jgi:hypothetical protein
MKDKQFKWKKQRELLRQVIRVEDSYGNYSALLLSNNHDIILDRTNSKFFVPFPDSFYILLKNWALWIKKGFITILLPVSPHYSVYYIFSIRDKRLIIKGTEVIADAFLDGKSNYFMVVNEDSKYAIFDKSGKKVSNWFNMIYTDGLVRGKSDYYVAIKGDKQAIYAIFHKDGRRITDWFDYVYTNGLVDGDSDYYIAKKDNQYAIFHKDGRQVSDWYDGVYSEGLVNGESDYYIVEKDKKKAIFHKNGQQISGWFDKIYPDGLVKGESDYYVISDSHSLQEFLYICKLDTPKRLGPLLSMEEFGFIKDPSENTITFEKLEIQRKILTKQELDDFFEKQELEHER